MFSLWLLYGLGLCYYLISSLSINEDGVFRLNFDWLNTSYPIGRSQRKTVVSGFDLTTWNSLQNVFIRVVILHKYCYIQPDLIKSYGYPCETHSVTTDDGYILTLHRIPGQNIAQVENGKPMKRKRKSPVFLGHSVVGSSAIWTFAPNHSLAYMLADQGIIRRKFHQN